MGQARLPSGATLGVWTTSWGAVAMPASRDEKMLSDGAVVVRARLTGPVPATNGVTSTSIHPGPAAAGAGGSAAPDVAPGAGGGVVAPVQGGSPAPRTGTAPGGRRRVGGGGAP